MKETFARHNCFFLLGSHAHFRNLMEVLLTLKKLGSFNGEKNYEESHEFYKFMAGFLSLITYNLFLADITWFFLMNDKEMTRKIRQNDFFRISLILRYRDCTLCLI